MRIALASPRVASSLDEGLEKVRWLMSDAASHGARIVCFPEAYLPGLRGLDFDVPPFDRNDQERILGLVSGWAGELGIATILGMERVTDAGRQVACVVFDGGGRLLGFQAKAQLDPSEERFYVPGARTTDVRGGRREVRHRHLPRGMALPGDGPLGGRARSGRSSSTRSTPGTIGLAQYPRDWCRPAVPYYEKAMMLRSIENTIYFASVNYALRYPESATSLIAPSGRLSGAPAVLARKACSCRRSSRRSRLA